MSMNLRHTAALALAGWYLMGPPMNSDLKVDDSAPISQWKIMLSFDTAAECEKKRAQTLREIAPRKQDAPYSDIASASVCVATDDPRLKETK